MNFPNEKALRKEVKKNLPRLLRIEPGTGGTFGLPDCLIPLGERLVPLELKVSFKYGSQEFHLNRNQRLCIKLMKQYGVVPLILVGEKNGSRLWLFTSEKSESHSTTFDDLYTDMQLLLGK